jgi:hypothetical protein
MREIMAEEAGKCDLSGLVKILMTNGISDNIEKAAQGVFPIKDTYIRKVKVLKKPKFGERARGRARRAERGGSMMTYKTRRGQTIMRVAGSATSAMRKPQIVKRVRNDEA